MATISKRKDGRFVGIIELGTDANGKRKRQYLYDTNKGRLKLKIAELESSLSKNAFVIPSKTLYNDFVDVWFDTIKPTVDEATAQMYGYNIDKIKNYFAGYKLQDIKPLNISAFYAEMLKTLKKNTVRKIHALVKKSFEKALINRLIHFNPAIGVDVPNKEKYQIADINTDNFNKLVDATKNTFWEMPITLAALMGLRRGEVLGLRWSDVDMKSKILHVRQAYAVRQGGCKFKAPKNDGSYRRIVIQDSVIEIFKRHKMWQFQNRRKNWVDNNLVVCYRTGTPHRPDDFSSDFKEMLERFEIPHIRFHDLRHFNATMMLKLGISDKMAQAWLGHKQVATLHEIYQHVLTEMEIEAAEKLNTVFGGQNGGQSKK